GDTGAWARGGHDGEGEGEGGRGRGGEGGGEPPPPPPAPPADSVHEADPEGLPGGARRRHPQVRVVVHERAPAPSHEQPQREGDDHEPDRHLRALLDQRRQIGLPKHDRDAQHDQRRRVSQPPGEAEPRRTSLAVRDEGRHGGEVVRIGRVPEPKDDGDRDDERECRAVGEVDEPAVEAEHQTPTLPTARTTMPRPATTMTAALIAGRTAAMRPRPSNCENAPFASTARSPTEVIASARPRLKAPTSAIP